jgi:hypothetical protein
MRKIMVCVLAVCLVAFSFSAVAFAQGKGKGKGVRNLEGAKCPKTGWQGEYAPPGWNKAQGHWQGYTTPRGWVDSQGKRKGWQGNTTSPPGFPKPPVEPVPVQ